MNKQTAENVSLFPPLKSVAVALLFCVALGPVGLLYSSLLGGTLMIVIGYIVVRAKLLGLIAVVWLISCIVGVAVTNRYNKKILTLHQQSM